ncbi:hypothetical protein FHX48_001638 [Microbacterium halimionae]|uniref:Uncharacterized protein n=1 Tax=Microbacterium halimionae TaxID=1526413 RepID=A0A7W3JPC9_9MICO|nr:hypothetical protein [Microbacterium halimionae]MBA8816565.1 hypothetical protein [Microbacterium halimionae]NII95248.1 hypothetical protein [Microbacterium halimionae]
MKAGKFEIADARATLVGVLAEDGISPEALPIRRAFELMIEFFSKWEPLGVNLDEDGDGLLFQWGTYDWDGAENPLFEVDITRQLITNEDDEHDEEMHHLHWTFQYEPSDVTQGLGTGEAWFFAPVSLSHPFQGILTSPTLLSIEGMVVHKVVLEHELV